MNINRKLIRDNFLKMRDEEHKKMRDAENLKKQMQDEINNRAHEIKLMTYEDMRQKRIMFYEKMKVNQFDMYIEFLFDTQNKN